MKIEDFEFGSIKIDGIKYDKDLIITPRGIIPNWWRREGHKVFWADLSFLDFEGIKYLIIGNGWSSAVKVMDDLKEKMKELNIRIISVNSKNALKEYENLKSQAILALHLTC
jgi:hypothetical protein